MHKNSPFDSIITELIDKSNMALLFIFGMALGFLVSPALNSICIFLFGINSIRDVPIRKWIRNPWWILGIAWILFFAFSGLRGGDMGYWAIRLQVKLAFLVLPLAFTNLPEITGKKMSVLYLSLGFLLVGGAFYSLYFLFTEYNYYLTQYMYSHLLPTPVRQDHIRFSLCIALYICATIAVFPSFSGRVVKALIILTDIILGLYLHVLAAKSGLLSLYVVLLGFGLYVTFSKKSILGIASILSLCLGFYLAIHYLPTFKKRFEYTYVSWLAFKNKDKTGNYGDVNRLISYKIAARLIEEHPLAGVGTGKMEAVIQDSYNNWYPEVLTENRLVPHNEFLLAGVGCGLPCVVFMLIWVLYPLTQITRNRKGFFFAITWSILLLQLMIEPALEVQYGVWVFLFFMTLQWPRRNASMANTTLAQPI